MAGVGPFSKLGKKWVTDPSLSTPGDKAWIFEPFWNSYIDILTPMVTLLGGGALGRQLGLDEVLRTVPHDEIVFIRRDSRSCSLLPYEDTVRRRRSINQEESSHLSPAMLAHWAQTSSLQNCAKINFCCLSHPVYGILLWQHKQTNSYGKAKKNLEYPKQFWRTIKLDDAHYLILRLTTNLQ